MMNVPLCYTQMLNNREGKALEDAFLFNRSFIWENKIASITAIKQIKLPGRPIDDMEWKEVMVYNSTGILEKKILAVQGNSFQDSSSILFKRNDIGQLFSIEQNKKTETTITQMSYDSNGKITREDVKQVLHIQGENSREILVESTTYEYQFPQPNMVVRNNINNYGLTYSAYTTIRNDQGFLLKEIENFFVSQREITTTYEYNENGWVSKTVKTDNKSNEKEETSFTYDNKGNVIFAKLYINNELVEEFEVLYNQASMIKAILHQDIASQAITIHKYEYQFR
jgi:hypothetical protein